MKNAYDLALDFSKDLVKTFGGLIHAVALFGSHTKNRETEKSDVDILIIVDDVKNVWDDLVKTWYWKKLSEILRRKEYHKIHANTITLTTFWDMVRVGDPLIINILRTGIPIVDSSGIFESLKRLLYMGKIKPTPEAINAIKARIPHHHQSYRYHVLKALESAYWIFVDSAHYMLMTLGFNPPSPEEITSYLQKLSEKKIIDGLYAKWYKEIYDLIHKISHGEVENVSADVVEEWYIRAKDFSDYMEKVVRKYLENLKKKA